MRPPAPPLFLERRSYRQRRVRDAARLLPLLGVVLWLMPLMFAADGDPAPTSRAMIYIFGVWLGLIAAAAALTLGLDPATDDSAQPADTPETTADRPD